jgi:hypothetical protein
MNASDSFDAANATALAKHCHSRRLFFRVEFVCHAQNCISKRYISKQIVAKSYQHAIFIAMKREFQLLLRLSEEEKRAFSESAEVAGVTVSAWMRQQLRRSAAQELARVGKKAPFLKPVTIGEQP